MFWKKAGSDYWLNERHIRESGIPELGTEMGGETSLDRERRRQGFYTFSAPVMKTPSVSSVGETVVSANVCIAPAQIEGEREAES